MSDLRIGPINAATPTPLTAAGCLDAGSARRLARRWMDVGLDGVLLLGSMGEGTRLTDAARDQFVALAAECTGGVLTLFASAADLSRERMRERALRYASLGAHCITLSVPPGSSPSRGIADVMAVADACPVPCCYYEVPEITGTRLVVEELRRLLSHGNIRALKDSSNNSQIAQAITSDAFRPPGVALLDGVEYRAAFSAALGYDGVLHGGGVLTARRVRRIWELCAQGAVTCEALDLDRKNSLFLSAIYNRLSGPLQNIVGQKYALRLLGVLDHETVVVDQVLDDASRRRIEALMERNRSWLDR